jgi:nitric-oxide synthase
VNGSDRDQQTTTVLERYHSDTDELVWAARVAWRNEARCIGRARWASAVVRDRRDLVDPQAIAVDLVEHLRQATNGGRIRSVVTVLHPEVLIRNDQIIGYAGYRGPDGSILGDPRNVDLTLEAFAVGWPGGRPRTQGAERRGRSRWDVLPLLLQGPGGERVAHELPAGAVLQVHLRHPEHRWFGDLDLRWYAVPALTTHRLVLTDQVSYPVAISGWYLSSEVACRDLADADRYDALPEIAERLGLDTSSRRTLWEGVAENVLHQAVLASFDAAGVRISDPPAESDLYMRFVAAEQRRGRPVHADWSWIVPPWHGARLAVYHGYQDPPDASLLPAYRPLDPVATSEAGCPRGHSVPASSP